MLRSRIAPCLLLENGDLVKTRTFAPGKYVGDPLNAVRIFNEKQVDELVLFDISATVGGGEPDLRLLERISAEARMPLCYGGGIKSVATAEALTSLGYEKISLSSSAVANPNLVREISAAIGSQSVCVTLDVRKLRAGTYGIYTHKGTKPHEALFTDAVRNFERLGAGEIIINSIDRDGTMEGYDLELAEIVRRSTDLPLTFVGGAGSVEHMEQLIDRVGICGAGAGSLFVFKGKYNAVLLSYARAGLSRS